ncbi:MAG TPA: hypothetical protein VMV02_04025 [Acidimicrobiales bacterium]|nr:hypothetical protein [Acidimicrobiales bacterium]
MPFVLRRARRDTTADAAVDPPRYLLPPLPGQLRFDPSLRTAREIAALCGAGAAP